MFLSFVEINKKITVRNVCDRYVNRKDRKEEETERREIERK